MDLSADGLQLNFAARSPFDDEGWARVAVTFSVPSVSGCYDSWVERSNLERFRQALDKMSRTLEPASSGILVTAEDDYRVKLQMEDLGHIAGSYVLAPGRANSSQVSVSGNFTMDQSYLPALIDQLDSLIRQLSQ